MRPRDSVRRAALPLWAGLFVLTFTRSSFADEVMVKGVRLKGTVKEIKTSGIVFETELGSGAIEIPYGEIESLETEEEFLVLHGDDGEVTGRLVGVRDGELLVGDSQVTATPVAVDSIVMTGLASDDEGLDASLRRRFRYWKGSGEFGLSFKDSTTDQTDITAGLRFERRKKPTRFLLEGFYLYGREKAQGEPSSKTDNELRGLVKGEWDPLERFLLYTSHDVEYDEIENISLRWVGKLGPAYRPFDSETFRLQLETGLAYTYERFFGGDVEESVGAVFGTEGFVALYGKTTLAFRADYVPALDDWVDDYLVRAQATLDVPVSDWLSFRTTVLETYDSTPAEDTQRNELKVILSLAWRF